LHTVLKDYKRSPSARVRERHRWQVGAILHRFVFHHRECITGVAGMDWDTVTIVPSKTGRVGTHPLEEAIMLGEPLRSEYRRLLEPAEVELLGRARSSDRGFRATDEARARTVLLLDDTITSGSTFQSSASALVLGGATVVAGVVIGRVIDTSNPDYPDKLELWEQQRRQPFSFDVCCLE
jgi:predicted amidophosphoribosyltransferase